MGQKPVFVTGSLLGLVIGTSTLCPQQPEEVTWKAWGKQGAVATGFLRRQRGRAVYRQTHHTQYDTFETVVPEYQQHSSFVIAVGAYGVAKLDKLLPRDAIEQR